VFEIEAGARFFYTLEVAPLHKPIVATSGMPDPIVKWLRSENSLSLLSLQ
jgi:hypothetical protein